MKIEYACSLGPFCHSANILKQNNLKECSYPFDWIFSNNKNIIHCIKDNFKLFLNKKYYMNISNKRCGHSYYNKELFRHHNPLTNENDYNYFVRCVNRFKDLLYCKGHKLFITIIVNNDSIDKKIIHNSIKINKKLSRYTTNYTLLVILHLKNKQQNYHNFTYKDNIQFLELHTLSDSDGLSFKNDTDNKYLDNIIKKTYTLNKGDLKEFILYYIDELCNIIDKY